MTQPLPPPAGLHHWATTIAIPTTWTPAQALAVFELLDDLRETVATRLLAVLRGWERAYAGSRRSSFPAIR